MIKIVEVKVKTLEHFTGDMPKYETVGASGMDVVASCSDVVEIESGTCRLIPTGLSFNIPSGYEIQVRSRSGLALKKGLFVLNGIGTIDSDYTGEVKVLLYNSGKDTVYINRGDRIAQLVLAEVPKINWVEVKDLKETERGEGGFGSTGLS